ncbi:MAG: tripartite tricarboxylate transporter substrate-binding protein, partial [Rubrivivax sp.]
MHAADDVFPATALARSRRALLLALLGACGVLGAGLASAQGYPNKPIKLLVGFPPGGGIDTVARNLQPGLQDALGQTVVVDYKPGAGGVLAATELTRAPPYGYTILVANLGPFVLVPNMVSKKPYDPQIDFTYIHQTSGSGFIAAVPVNHPASTLAQFI